MLLYDLPGYGQSQEYQRQASDLDGSLFEGDTSVKFQGEALAALLHHLQLDGKNGNQAPAVIAHDIAGAIVLRAPLLLGCQFSSLLLMDTNAVLPWGDNFYNLVRSAPQIFTNLPPHTFEALLRATIQSASHQPSKLHPGGWEDILAAPWLPTPSSAPAPAPAPVPQRQHQHNFVRQIAQATDTDVAELLHRNLYRHVRCPVKILWGAHDAWIPREKLERLAHLLGERVEEFVVVPEAGHLVMVDQPERVAVEVLSWLARKV